MKCHAVRCYVMLCDVILCDVLWCDVILCYSPYVSTCEAVSKEMASKRVQ